MDREFHYLEVPANVPPALEPISPDNSETIDDLERDIQLSFIAVFEATIRPALARLNSYGAPHLADFTALERFTKAEGLAMDRRDGGEDFMRELFRAWRARNPKRGLAFLRLYLQLLYPGTATVDQLWQDPTRDYPGSAHPVEAPGDFLTSRVRVSLAASASLTGEEISRIRSIALSVIPARMVLEMYLTVGDGVEAGMSLSAGGDVVQLIDIGGTATTIP